MKIFIVMSLVSKGGLVLYPMFIYNIILELLKTQNVASFVVFICELVFPPPIKLLIIDIVKILLKLYVKTPITFTQAIYYNY
jgi:hypothetical protein